MANHVAETSIEPQCHCCGYDLRAQTQDAKCPECNASVAESIRLSNIPRRPAWQNSDPRWRRRMLAGVWVLVLIQLMDVVMLSDSARDAAVPTVINYRGGLTLGETFLCEMRLYPQLMFCIGVVLLFSKERGRQISNLDWTRRWGVLCTYVTLLLTATSHFLITSLVGIGISSLFMSMPPRYQPGITATFTKVSCACLRYGPQPNGFAYLVMIMFSTTTILLACVAFREALRSSGLKYAVPWLVGPIGLMAVIQILEAVLFFTGFSSSTATEIYSQRWYFQPDVLVPHFVDWIMGRGPSNPLSASFCIEAAKWCAILTIAIWLSAAQLLGNRTQRRSSV